ncbi:TIGR02270 family protein [Caballeronia sp. S22]|jgi:uncharacterized protein (TIGR02270 family)|uniref:TIGR02270 family protein n=1 Tax=Caballeronia sp. S22 TaxID=3137182 RepID=UPI00353146AE
MNDDASIHIPRIVAHHVSEAAFLRATRTRLRSAAHVALKDLARHDERIDAQLDGIAVAGDFGSAMCDEALEDAGAGEVFTAAAVALTSGDLRRLTRILALAKAVPATRRGLLCAFGWVGAAHLEHVVRRLLESDDPFVMECGLAACAMHRVDPGRNLVPAAHTGGALRCRALRVAGECHRPDLLRDCIDAYEDDNPACRFWAARSAAFLGERVESAKVLMRLAQDTGPMRAHALRLAIQLSDPSRTAALLEAFSGDAGNVRLLLFGVGVSGDPHYANWLIRQMETTYPARAAGEALSLITGANLVHDHLEGAKPADAAESPGDDTGDDDVSMNDDDDLRWPDPEKVAVWWKERSGLFRPGTRYFMGNAVTQTQCLTVLANGYQRQRFLAADYLRLLLPDSRLFSVCAPARRQRRWLVGSR